MDPRGRALRDPEQLRRIKGLAIPPAWQEVWICPDPLGHLQSTGVDAAGRKQYLYHPRWREQRDREKRDREKFTRVMRFATALPKLRRRVRRTLRASDDVDHERVLSCAIRLLDIGLFGIGGEEYADDDGGTGLATVRKDNVTVSGDEVTFDYLAKGGVRRIQAVRDRPTVAVLAVLRRRRSGGEVDRIGSLGRPDDRRRARLEHAVLDLLDERRGSAAVERFVRAA